MTRILKKIFLLSLLLYLASTLYTRFKDCSFRDFSSKVLYSLPWDVYPLNYLEAKDRVLIQVGVLSTSEVAELFKTNPDQFPHCYEGTTLNVADPSSKDYIVLRFKNIDAPHWGNIKCYCSCFPQPTVQSISLPWQMTSYYNIVLPYPECLEQNSTKQSTVSVRWKHF